MSEAKIVQFHDSKVRVAFGLDCQTKGKHRAENLFTLEAKFFNFTKGREGIYKTILSTHFCTYSDFFNDIMILLID